MDLSAPLIFMSIFVLALISLFLVYKYGIKKKSYEEALAEHRKQTSALLGTKPKPKEKKNKKVSKKTNKEKPNVPPAAPQSENESPDETESQDSKDVADNIEVVKPQVSNKTKGKGSNKQTKTHVEFKEEPIEVPVEVPAEKEVKEVINKKRVKKTKPILNKKSDSEITVVSPASAEAPPANHFEEIHPKDECEMLHSNSKENTPKPEPPKEEKKPEKTVKKNKQNKDKSQPQQQQVEKDQTVEASGEPNKPVIAAIVEKEKPKEEKVLENHVAPLIHEAVVANTGKEKKKKKSEYNSRQQITAERDQLIHSVRNAELSRTEVQLLIDMLLNKQLEAPAVIDDWSEGKSDPVQKLKKQLADKEKQLADEQEALAGVQAKLKEVRNEQVSERVQLQQKVRAAEESKVEIVAAHNRLQLKIQELEDYRNKELTNLQRIMEENKALQLQRSQLEATLMNYQDTEAIIHNLKAENAHLSNELQLLGQDRQEQMTNYQNCVLQIQTLQEELRKHSYLLTTQTEETHKVSEQLQRTAEAYINEEQKLKDIIAQLQSEKQQLLEEQNAHMNGSQDENKDHEVKVLNLTNELSSVKSELTSVNQSMLDAERQYQSKLVTSEQKFTQLERELEEQKQKNDELRKKNWKVMEALNEAETRNKRSSDKTEAVVNVDKITAEIRTKEQTAQKEFLQRLFPEIENLQSATSDDWQEEYERAIRQHISQLQQPKSAPASPEKSSELIMLQNEVSHYKKVIDDTEKMLRNLESHVKQEERTWMKQLSQKDMELQELKSQCVSQLQVQVSTLESQLAQEQAEKQRLLEERQNAFNRPEVKAIHSDSTATIERLSEEVNRLRGQLEQSKNGEASVYQNEVIIYEEPLYNISPHLIGPSPDILL